MTMSQDQVSVGDIEATVRAIPGVSAIFRSGTTVSKVIDAGARLLGIRDDDIPLVRVEQETEGLRVEVAIGVQPSAGAVETTRRVHAAIDALLAQYGIASAEIHITVVHVDDDPPS